MQSPWGLSILLSVVAFLIYIHMRSIQVSLYLPSICYFFLFEKNSLKYSVSFPKFLLQAAYFPPIPSHPLTFLSLFGFVQLLLRVGHALTCGPPNWLFFSQHLSDANISSASGGIPCIFCLYWLFYTWPRRVCSGYYSLFSFPVQQTTSLRSDVVVFHVLWLLHRKQFLLIQTQGPSKSSNTETHKRCHHHKQ